MEKVGFFSKGLRSTVCTLEMGHGIRADLSGIPEPMLFSIFYCFNCLFCNMHSSIKNFITALYSTENDGLLNFKQIKTELANYYVPGTANVIQIVKTKVMGNKLPHI